MTIQIKSDSLFPVTLALAQTVQAVLDRWDSPRWDWAKPGPTGELMNEMRRALEKSAQVVQPDALFRQAIEALIPLANANFPSEREQISDHDVRQARLATVALHAALAQPVQPATSRESFEAYMMTRESPSSAKKKLAMREGVEYLHEHVARHWFTWQKATDAAQPVQLAAYMTNDKRMLIFADKVDAAIRPPTGMTPLYAAPQPAAVEPVQPVNRTWSWDKAQDTYVMDPPEVSAQPATCKKCAGPMKPGQAIAQTFSSGAPDFPGDTHGITMSPGGPGRLIACMKCEACGWSTTT